MLSIATGCSQNRNVPMLLGAAPLPWEDNAQAAFLALQQRRRPDRRSRYRSVLYLQPAIRS